MKILLISQVFWPDTASTSQHLYDLAEYLSTSHDVTVISSRNNYENPKEKYSSFEKKGKISIIRIANTSFGKRNIFSRLVDFFSFNILLIARLAKVRKADTDIILGLTSPPLISFFGAWFAKRKGIPFVYWTMDLQPELSIASGLIKENSIVAGLFLRMGNYTFRNSSRIIALDNYMAEYAIKRGANKKHVDVVPVWPVVEKIYSGLREENPFRIQNRFQDKIVIMYSGNHSVIHPLDTLLNAALSLKEDKRFLFVFVGGGVRKKDVTGFKKKHDLDNIVQLSYQPRNVIHISLASADIQVVILGNNQVGFTHPNKIYGAMFIAKPILYIGPTRSHITDILSLGEGNIIVEHDNVPGLVQQLLSFAKYKKWNEIGSRNREIANNNFHPDILKEKMAAAVLNYENFNYYSNS